MSRWRRGEGEIENLIAAKQLQQVIGGQANGADLLQKASRTLATAGEIADKDPDSAYVLAYDAARYAGTAILAHQGLRPTTSGGHYVIEVALRAQFGDGFRPFGAMRRRRNELEYPTGESPTVATFFACGAGDGNRTRTVSLGIPYGPAIRAHVADLT